MSQASGESVYANHAGNDVLGVYQWLPELGVALLVEQEQSEIYTSIYQTLALNLGVAVVLVIGAVIASLLTSRSIANPLAHLAETASEIAAGSLGQFIEAERADEIGTLAQAFNDPRRSRMLWQLAAIHAYSLVEPDELARFTPETREAIESLANEFLS